jgi:hypothetical protein
VTKKEKKFKRVNRRMVGGHLIGGARAMESCVGFTADGGLIGRKHLTKKEKRVLDKAQRLLGEGTHLLRVLGNHLENPPHEAE